MTERPKIRTDREPIKPPPRSGSDRRGYAPLPGNVQHRLAAVARRGHGASREGSIALPSPFSGNMGLRFASKRPPRRCLRRGKIHAETIKNVPLAGLGVGSFNRYGATRHRTGAQSVHTARTGPSARGAATADPDEPRSPHLARKGRWGSRHDHVRQRHQPVSLPVGPVESCLADGVRSVATAPA